MSTITDSINTFLDIENNTQEGEHNHVSDNSNYIEYEQTGNNNYSPAGYESDQPEDNKQYPMIEQTIIEHENTPSAICNEPPSDDEIIKFIKNNMVSLLTEAMSVVPTVTTLVADSESSRDVLALSELVKAVSGVNKDLHEMVMTKKETEKENVTINQTAVFNGSTEDLIKSLFPRTKNND
jgi:hypothetical protein